MAVQEQDMRQVQQLQEQLIPRLYRAAVYLLGDVKTAETAVARSWEELLAGQADRQDECHFVLRARRALLRHCQTLRSCAESCPGRFEGEFSPLLQSLSGLPFAQRELIVLAAVENCGADEIARILGLPLWLVERRLHRATEKVCSVSSRKDQS